jgi:hypothetical protein
MREPGDGGSAVGGIALLVNAVSTWYLTGLIWVVQLVHYPAFARIDAGLFPRFHGEHGAAITAVVAGPMLAEAASAVLLVLRPPAAASRRLAALGVALVVVIWASTAWLQVPEHARLAEGFDPDVHARLVDTNWIRTVAWSLRAVLVAALLAPGLGLSRRDRRSPERGPTP